jgi:hypothetical protein
VSGPLDQVLERVRQNQTAQREAASAAAPSSAFTARLGGGEFLAGDRVFDTVSGLPGMVEASNTTITPPSTLITVRLERGDVVVRSPAKLVLRPTPPEVRP